MIDINDSSVEESGRAERGYDQLATVRVALQNLYMPATSTPILVGVFVIRTLIGLCNSLHQLLVLEAHHRSALSVYARKRLPNPVYPRYWASEAAIHNVVAVTGSLFVLSYAAGSSRGPACAGPTLLCGVDFDGVRRGSSEGRGVGEGRASHPPLSLRYISPLEEGRGSVIPIAQGGVAGGSPERGVGYSDASGERIWLISSDTSIQVAAFSEVNVTGSRVTANSALTCLDCSTLRP